MSEPQEIFARLLALSKIQEARVKANPLPFLNKIAQENHKLRQAISEALFHISGASSIDFASQAFPERPPSIVETATMRNSKAAEILAAAIR